LKSNNTTALIVFRFPKMVVGTICCAVLFAVFASSSLFLVGEAKAETKGIVCYCGKQLGPSATNYDCVVACGDARKRSGPTPRDLSNNEINTGNAYWNQRRWKEAIAAYRRALSYDPTNRAARENISAAYNKWGLEYKNNGDLANAEWAYRKAIEEAGNLFPERAATAHNNLGGVFAEKKQWDRALSEFREALRLNPNDKTARDNLIGLQNHLKRQAEKQARKNKIDQLAADARQLANADNYERALQVLRELLGIIPGDPWTLHEMGYALYRLNRFDEAIRQMELAMRNGGDRKSAENFIKQIKISRERHQYRSALNDAKSAPAERAVANLESLINRYPNRQSELGMEIAKILQETGQENEYRDWLERIVANGDDGTFAFKKAKRQLDAYWAKKTNESIKSDDLEGRLAALSELRKSRPNDPNVDISTVSALEKLDRQDDAFALLQTAVEKYPDNARLLRDLAWHMYLRGEKDKAVALAKRSLEIDGEDGATKDILERASGYEGTLREIVEKDLRIGKRIDAAIETAKNWFADEPTDQHPETAQKPAERVVGGFGAKEPPVPIVAALSAQSGSTVKLSQRAFDAIPQPVTKVSKAAVTATREVWERAKIEARDMTRNTGLDWVAGKVRYGASVVSLMRQSKTLYRDFSTPIHDHLQRTMADAQRGVAAQVGEDDLEDKAYSEAAKRRGEAIFRMTQDLTKESLEWRLSGALAEDGNPSDEKIHLGDKLVEYVENVFDLKSLWAFNNEEEIEKWSLAQSQK